MPLKLLLVDDDDGYCELVEAVFSDSEQLSDIQIRRIDNGRSAIKYLKEGRQGHSEHWPDLMVVDQRMGDVDGLEVLRWIRASDIKDIPWVCLMSSSEQPKLIEDVDKLGFFYSTKPLVLEDFEPIYLKIRLRFEAVTMAI